MSEAVGMSSTRPYSKGLERNTRGTLQQRGHYSEIIGTGASKNVGVSLQMIRSSDSTDRLILE